ncbi:MAG: hypothetical protein ACYTBP_04780 [Planctomycetota bacterium]
MFCDDREKMMFRCLTKYIDVVHRLAKEFDAVLVTLHSCINEQLKQVSARKWSNDAVRPYYLGAWLNRTGSS